MALLDPTTVEEEEDGWFGDGSAFDSGEDLAAALMNLAGRPVARTAVADEEAGSSVFEEHQRSNDMIFELLTRATGEIRSLEVTAPPRKWSSDGQAHTWTERKPGSMSLPARKPGKTGWSIRSSVLLLQRAEEVLITLREEAVDSSLTHAARAINRTR
ncbi:MAG: hypothetical protein JOZ75_04820 [Candidatus Dormibacteraeota bacterium]|nr:hypothetical protein [Candidatus Dormibacteraeota bacterium]